jgi:hypothetical protein
MHVRIGKRREGFMGRCATHCNPTLLCRRTIYDELRAMETLISTNLHRPRRITPASPETKGNLSCVVRISTAVTESQMCVWKRHECANCGALISNERTTHCGGAHNPNDPASTWTNTDRTQKCHECSLPTPPST